VSGATIEFFAYSLSFSASAWYVSAANIQILVKKQILGIKNLPLPTHIL
jgi:hypothetical protein